MENSVRVNSSIKSADAFRSGSGLLKALHNRLSRSNSKEKESSSRDLSEPASPLAAASSRNGSPFVNLDQFPPAKQSLQARRSVPCPLILNSLPENSSPPFRITVRRTHSSPDSDVPPKVPERSPISLGLIPSSPDSPNVVAKPMTKRDIEKCLPVPPSPSRNKPLPPIPAEDDLENPPEEFAPPIPVEPFIFRPVDEISPVTRELHRLSKCGYYWGPISRAEAEQRLEGKCDGSFLLRNSVDKRYLLSLSFRSLGRTLHARVEYENEVWSFSPRINDEVFPSVVDLIEDAMNKATVCYSRGKEPDSPTFPVRLSHPVNRFAEVRSLAALCRFVIRLHIRADYIDQMELLLPSFRKFLS